jgi:hypothetical protein
MILSISPLNYVRQEICFPVTVSHVSGDRLVLVSNISVGYCVSILDSTSTQDNLKVISGLCRPEAVHTNINYVKQVPVYAINVAASFLYIVLFMHHLACKVLRMSSVGYCQAPSTASIAPKVVQPPVTLAPRASKPASKQAPKAKAITQQRVVEASTDSASRANYSTAAAQPRKLIC